jgi:S-formylglutathione hydrolase FrmB
VSNEGAVSRRALLVGGLGGITMLAGGGALAQHEVGTNPRLRRLFYGCGTTPPIPHSDFHVVDGSLSSVAMSRQMDWQVALPPGGTRSDRPTPLVLVLTGATGTPPSLSDVLGMPGFATAAGLQVAFACPDKGDAALYYHPRASGQDPMTWILDEFLPHIERRFHVGGSTANRAVYGWSMGGFASLLFASQQPRRFCAAVASSPAVFPTYQDAVIGHSGTFDTAEDWQRWGLWEHLSDLDGVPVMINCGDADAFSGTARQLIARIPGAVGGIGHGCHDQGFWHRQEPAQLEFLARHLRVDR